jgi:gluconolactonase
MRYEVLANGTLSKSEIFFHASSAARARSLDGMKVDSEGNVYVTSSHGIIIISPTGKHLGTIEGPEEPLNLAWGDSDWKTLYITARTGLYRMHLNIPGSRH